MSDSEKLAVCHTRDGFLLRVVGRGTMKESPAAREFVEQALSKNPPGEIGIDLAECDYLDSTFLGCLIGMQRCCAKLGTRLAVYANPSRCQQLLGPTRLEKVLRCSATVPQPVSGWVPLTLPSLDRQEFGWHVLECHRRLAELDCPQAAAFQAVCDQLAEDLAEPQPPRA